MTSKIQFILRENGNKMHLVRDGKSDIVVRDNSFINKAAAAIEPTITKEEIGSEAVRRRHHIEDALRQNISDERELSKQIADLDTSERKKDIEKQAKDTILQSRAASESKAMFNDFFRRARELNEEIESAII